MRLIRRSKITPNVQVTAHKSRLYRSCKAMSSASSARGALVRSIWGLYVEDIKVMKRVYGDFNKLETNRYVRLGHLVDGITDSSMFRSLELLVQLATKVRRVGSEDPMRFAIMSTLRVHSKSMRVPDPHRFVTTHSLDGYLREESAPPTKILPLNITAVDSHFDDLDGIDDVCLSAMAVWCAMHLASDYPSFVRTVGMNEAIPSLPDRFRKVVVEAITPIEFLLRMPPNITKFAIKRVLLAEGVEI